MTFLLGDSTPSQLDVNFIEVLREAIDFCVRVLLADEKIALNRQRGEALQAGARASLDRLQKLEATVSAAVGEATAADKDDPHATHCRSAIVQSASDLVRAEVAAVQSALSVEVAKLDAHSAGERSQCFKALEGFLLKHNLPDTTLAMQLQANGGGRYVGRLIATTGFGLESTIDLEIPVDHLFAHLIRVDRLTEKLEVQLPEQSVRTAIKDNRPRSLRLERHHLIEVDLGATGAMLKLRLAPDGTGGGVDVRLQHDSHQLRVVRVGDRGEPASPPFEVSTEDASRLRDFYNLLSPAAELKKRRRSLVDASLDGQPLRECERPAILVERVIASLEPIVTEIAAHSLSPDELVLRRMLGDDRREEIFVRKSDLRRKLDPLSASQRSVFAAFGLNGASIERAPTQPAVTSVEAPAASGAINDAELEAMLPADIAGHRR